MKASCQSRLNCKYRAAGSCWDIRCNRIFKARQASFKITVSRLTSQEASHHLSIKKWLHKRPVSKQISTLINKRISFHSSFKFTHSLGLASLFSQFKPHHDATGHPAPGWLVPGWITYVRFTNFGEVSPQLCWNHSFFYRCYTVGMPLQPSLPWQEWVRVMLNHFRSVSMTAYYRKSDFRENKYMKEFNDGSGGYGSFPRKQHRDLLTNVLIANVLFPIYPCHTCSVFCDYVHGSALLKKNMQRKGFPQKKSLKEWTLINLS